MDLYDPAQLSLPPNFRESPLEASLNNQGTPGQHFYRDSNYQRNINKLSAGPPRDAEVMKQFIQAYYATISHLDSQIGAVVEQMKTAGLWQNTILIFLSDNGYHLGSHGLGNKITMHEESVRIPMFATGPGITGRRRSKELVSSLDVYPTLLEMAGVEIPERAMGKSLVPLFENREAAIRNVVFSECVGVQGKRGQGHRMACDGRHKLILSGTDEIYLFDLATDPSELQNVAGEAEYRKVRKHLESELASWMQLIGDRPFSTN